MSKAKLEPMSAAEKASIREATCRKALDALAAFEGLSDDDLNEAIVMSMLLSAGDGSGFEEVSEADMGIAMTYFAGIRMQLTALRFALCGAVAIYVKDGEVMMEMRNPDELIGALVQEGIATEVKN